jgi:hypothetical protein
MGRWSERRYERVDRYPLGRAPRWEDDEPSQVRRAPSFGYEEHPFDDFERPAGLPRGRFRQVAWRFVGTAAIGGAVYGVGQIAVHKDARHEIAEWVTLGHSERLVGVERTVEKWIDRVRTW